MDRCVCVLVCVCYKNGMLQMDVSWCKNVVVYIQFTGEKSTYFKEYIDSVSQRTVAHFYGIG